MSTYHCTPSAEPLTYRYMAQVPSAVAGYLATLVMERDDSTLIVCTNIAGGDEVMICLTREQTWSLRAMHPHHDGYVDPIDNLWVSGTDYPLMVFAY